MTSQQGWYPLSNLLYPIYGSRLTEFNVTENTVLLVMLGVEQLAIVRGIASRLLVLPYGTVQRVQVGRPEIREVAF